LSPVARTKGLPFALRDKCNVNNKDKCEKQILRCAKDDKVGGGDTLFLRRRPLDPFIHDLYSHPRVKVLRMKEEVEAASGWSLR